MNSKHKSNIPIRIAVILLCAVLFSSHLASGMLAKYTTGYSGDDNAKVVGVDLDVVNLALSNDGYTFDVQNGSDVAFDYDILVTFDNPSGAPSAAAAIDKTSVKLNNADYSTVSADGKTFTFANVATIDPGESKTGYVLTFDVKKPGVFVDSSLNKLSVYRGDDFTFNVALLATQAD